MINLVVEGQSDVGAAKAIVRAVDGQVNRVIVKHGKTKLDPLIPNFCRAARFENWVVLRDSDTKCPVTLRARLLENVDTSNNRFALRIAHPMTEGWLMADPVRFADYFEVNVSSIPRDVEHLHNAKQTLLHICSQSRSAEIRSSLVLDDGRTGPMYVDYINEFAVSRWRPLVAAENSESLRRALDRIRSLPKTA